MEKIDLDRIITDLFATTVVPCSSSGPKAKQQQQQPPPLDLDTLKTLCHLASAQFKKQSVSLDLASPVLVCGDIHGQFHDLQTIFKKFGKVPTTSYLFLGDYVDRGDHSLEVISLLFALKVKHPFHLFLLRGNHECSLVNENYGFKKECERRYGKDQGNQAWLMVNSVFQWMPLSAVIEDKILCLHGGLSPDLQTLAQLKQIRRQEIYNIPESGLVCDLTWSDPDKLAEAWSPSDRGVSYLFNCEVVEAFCKKNNLDLICRAHQLVDEGYEFFCNRKLITVFSAPNYCGNSGNRGAVLKVDGGMKCSIDII
jgi:serine/threonine-protein phosphatase PP1 catalytic subunit